MTSATTDLTTDVSDFEAEFDATSAPVAPTSTRESRAAHRAAMTVEQDGQYRHGFAWLVVGLIISIGAFGAIALHHADPVAGASSSVSSTVAP
jgi:hypothetical protein